MAYEHWLKTRTLIAGLWPAWNPTEIQVQEWKSALAYRNPEWVEQAVRHHYRESKWKEPKLAAILSHFKGLCGSSPSRPSGDHEKIAKWEREYDRDMEIISRFLIATPVETLREAKEKIGRRYPGIVKRKTTQHIGVAIAGAMEVDNEHDDPLRWSGPLRQWVHLFLTEPGYAETFDPPPAVSPEPEIEESFRQPQEQQANA